MEKRRLQKKPIPWDGLKRAILSVEISFMVHETENSQKVLTAVRNIMPRRYVNDILFKTERLWGHYKNLVILGKTTLNVKKIAYVFVKTLYKNLKKNDRDEIAKTFKRRLDAKNIFFLRLDKQKAYFGKIQLGNMDPILIKIKLNFSPNNFTEIITLKSN